MIDFENLTNPEKHHAVPPRVEGEKDEQYKDRLKAYVQGIESQQAKIDKLKSDNQLSESQIGQACVKWKEIAEKRQSKVDELQARIDEITNHVGINFDEERDDDQHSYWSGYNQAMRELNDILKGNKDD